MNTISLFFFSTPILSIICYHLIGNIWLPSIYRDWSRQTYYEAAGPTTKRSIAREILVAPMLLCIRSQQLIPVRLRFAIFTPPPSFPYLFLPPACVVSRAANTRCTYAVAASQGSLNNCNLRRGMCDDALSRKQVSRSFPRRTTIPHRLHARGPCARARAPFDTMLMPKNGDAAVCLYEYRMHLALTQQASTDSNSH